jgi:hypothetical protein
MQIKHFETGREAREPAAVLKIIQLYKKLYK